MTILRKKANIEIIRSKNWIDVSIQNEPALINMRNVIAITMDHDGKAVFHDSSSDEPFITNTDFESVEDYLSQA